MCFVLGWGECWCLFVFDIRYVGLGFRLLGGLRDCFSCWLLVWLSLIGLLAECFVLFVAYLLVIRLVTSVVV